MYVNPKCNITLIKADMKENDVRDFMKNGMLPPEAEKRLNEKAAQSTPSARMTGRVIALIIVLVGALVIALGMSSCTVDDDDGPDTDWYISGVWQNDYAFDEDMVFYTDGTGYWESVSTGSYMDFDYYCYGNWIYFTFYPVQAPPYTLDCRIEFIDDWHMYIVWPPDSFYGPATVYYSRIE